MGSLVDSVWHRDYFFTKEAVSKCFPLTAGFNIKEGENFNHPA